MELKFFILKDNRLGMQENGRNIFLKNEQRRDRREKMMAINKEEQKKLR